MRNGNLILRVAACMCLLAVSTLGVPAQKTSLVRPLGLTEAIEKFKKAEDGKTVQISRSVNRNSSPATGRFESSITTYRFKVSRQLRGKVLDPLIKVFMDNAERAYAAKTISPETPDDAEKILVSVDNAGKSWEFPSRKGKTIVGFAFVNDKDQNLRDYYLLRWFDSPEKVEMIEGQIYHILSKRPDVIDKEKQVKNRMRTYWFSLKSSERMEIIREAMKDNPPRESMVKDLANSYSIDALPEKVVQSIAKYWSE